MSSNKRKPDDGDDEGGESKEEESKTKKPRRSLVLSSDFANPRLPIAPSDWRLVADAVTQDTSNDTALAAVKRGWEERCQAIRDLIMRSSMLTDTPATAKVVQDLFDASDFIERPLRPRTTTDKKKKQPKPRCCFSGSATARSLVVLKIVRSKSSHHHRQSNDGCTTDDDPTPAEEQPDTIVISQRYASLPPAIVAVTQTHQYLQRQNKKLTIIKELTKDERVQRFEGYRDTVLTSYNKALTFLLLVTDSPIMMMATK